MTKRLLHIPTATYWKYAYYKDYQLLLEDCEIESILNMFGRYLNIHDNQQFSFMHVGYATDTPVKKHEFEIVEVTDV